MKFRKKPVEIEAVRFCTNNDDGSCAKATANWVNNGGGKADTNGTDIFIETLEGTMRASCGDWIIKGVAGEFYPCKPDIFKKTYELVEGKPDCPMNSSEQSEK